MRGLGNSVLEGDDVVTGLHVGDALTNGLNNTSTLVSENNREVALGVLSGERVGVYSLVSVIAHAHAG